jgi:hypothetical protein
MSHGFPARQTLCHLSHSASPLGLLKITNWPLIYYSIKKNHQEISTIHFWRRIYFQEGSLHEGLSSPANADWTECFGQCSKSKKMKSLAGELPMLTVNGQADKVSVRCSLSPS